MCMLLCSLNQVTWKHGGQQDTAGGGTGHASRTAQASLHVISDVAMACIMEGTTSHADPGAVATAAAVRSTPASAAPASSILLLVAWGALEAGQSGPSHSAQLPVPLCWRSAWCCSPAATGPPSAMNRQRSWPCLSETGIRYVLSTSQVADPFKEVVWSHTNPTLGQNDLHNSCVRWTIAALCDWNTEMFKTCLKRQA